MTAEEKNAQLRKRILEEAEARDVDHHEEDETTPEAKAKVQELIERNHNQSKPKES
ncbi:MAG: hypothetical protein HUJ22_08790 [Gracilimonas sp.]|uniref:hypothetical protein n=1 Tax=Gracilimonas sp. TaxID=1974203 RepID=UPI0019A89249|nr:hypothetical protein [Gracilimonas sp.]MBD3616657.1 hypothetical protein [Gracilimonas sp.]